MEKFSQAEKHLANGIFRRTADGLIPLGKTAGNDVQTMIWRHNYIVLDDDNDCYDDDDDDDWAKKLPANRVIANTRCQAYNPVAQHTTNCATGDPNTLKGVFVEMVAHLVKSVYIYVMFHPSLYLRKLFGPFTLPTAAKQP